MRLINTHSLGLEEFQDENGLQYAILSHRWEGDEVTLQDMESGVAYTKAGYTKIEKCCEQARRDGLPYAWVDTCCIDKRHSAELTEAINSMFRWYQNAEVCYAFLSDVKDRDDDLSSMSEDDLSLTSDDEFRVPPSFGISLWFSRGWTLQELLAPRIMRFYDCSWKFIGTKEQLTASISVATRIDWDVLKGASIHSCSIAQRMSWASNRRTTRVEDLAYSLMGLFEVNMPLIYGEGEKAFMRLQEEIIRHSDDYSIFAWSSASLSNYPGLLAPSPDAFADSGNIKPRQLRKKQSAYTMNNRGLSMTLELTPWTADTYLALLECVCRPLSRKRVYLQVGIYLRRLGQDDQYARITVASSHCHFFDREEMLKYRPIQAVTINVRQKSLFTKDDNPFNDRIYGYRICLEETPSLDGLVEVPYNNVWNSERCLMTMGEGRSGTVGVVDLGMFDRDVRKLKLGFDFDFNPLLFVAESEGLKDKVSPIAGSAESEDASQLVSFDTSNCLDHDGWSNTSPLADNQQYSGGQKGVWALRGDRINGLSVGLITSNRNWKQSIGRAVYITIQRGKFEEKEVWEVKLSGLEPPLDKPQLTVRQTLRKIFKG